MNQTYTEGVLVERPAIELFRKLGWETMDCFHEFEQLGGSPLGRETKGDVVLKWRLFPALEKLNPDLPPEALKLAKKNPALRRTRDLLLPKLISGELDASELDIEGMESDSEHE